MEKKRIVFTGGGTAGHVTPNIALMRALNAQGYSIHYVGMADSIEERLVAAEEYATFHAISGGKLRRYLSAKNIADAFRVLKGIRQAKKLFKSLQPDVLFSKGGYVSVPAVIGAHKRCPVIVHESDITPGLSNRIANRYADVICVTFASTLSHVKGKGVHTGTPIRKELFDGDKSRGFAFTGLVADKPVLLVMGGSQGAQAINDALRQNLPTLLRQFSVIHLTGKGKRDDAFDQPGYLQYEYIDEELADLFAITDIVLSRAGANAIFEFLALRIPALLVPLPLSASRGDQIQNAAYFQANGYADVLAQEDITPATLLAALQGLYEKRESYRAAMAAVPADGTEAVLKIIRGYADR